MNDTLKALHARYLSQRIDTRTSLTQEQFLARLHYLSRQDGTVLKTAIANKLGLINLATWNKGFSQFAKVLINEGLIALAAKETHNGRIAMVLTVHDSLFSLLKNEPMPVSETAQLVDTINAVNENQKKNSKLRQKAKNNGTPITRTPRATLDDLMPATDGTVNVRTMFALSKYAVDPHQEDILFVRSRESKDTFAYDKAKFGFSIDENYGIIRITTR